MKFKMLANFLESVEKSNGKITQGMFCSAFPVQSQSATVERLSTAKPLTGLYG